MKIVYLHGLESKPGGSKAQALKEAGFEVLNPALPKEPFDIAVKIAQDVINYERPSVIVGSSRGGAVAMAINPMSAQRVLIAPAWRKYGVSKNLDSAFVLHSETDDIVPFEMGLELFQKANEPKRSYFSENDDHMMKFNQQLLNSIEKFLIIDTQ